MGGRKVTVGMMIARKWVGRAVAVAALGAVAVGALPPTASNPAAAQTACADGLGSGGEFHPLTPTRVHDTRSGNNDPVKPGKKATSAGGNEYQVQLTGIGNVPANPADVLAVVMNVTVAEPEAQGNLSVRPSGAPFKDASLVNFLPGRNVPNLAIAGVGTDGKVTVRLFSSKPGRAHVVIDVSGWISTSCYATPGARLVLQGPGRIVDTRNANTPLGSAGDLVVKARGAVSKNPAFVVPNNANVTALLLNVTAVNRQAGSTNTNLAVTPTRLPKGQRAETSSTNVIAGQVKASMVIAPIGDDGNIYIRNFSGNTHVVVDVFGYFEARPADTTQTGRIIPLSAPFRAFDTRDKAFGSVPLGTGSKESWSFKAFAGSVTMPTAAGTVTLDQQSALIGNLTGTQLGRVYPTVPVSTFMSAYPGGVSRPDSSNINVPEGENVPNMSLLRYGTEGGDPYVVQMYNHMGSLHYILDVYAIVLR